VSGRRVESVAAAFAASPVALLAVRWFSMRTAPEGDPTAMVDIERSPVPGWYVVTLFAAALFATGALAWTARRGADGMRVVRGCFALGVAATVASAAVLR